jgi:hypothetical protein
MATWLLWQPMETAPPNGYIVVRWRQLGHAPIVVTWDRNSWRLDAPVEHQSLFTTDTFSGWSPIPPLEP